MKHLLQRRGVLVIVPTVVSLCLSCVASAQTTATLRTADTALSLRANSVSPELVQMSASDGAPWENHRLEKLIEFVEVAEGPSPRSSERRKIPIHWKFNGTASLHDPQHVVFIYESDSPHLRLTWEWKARAGFGPIEHQIRIENLDSREYWIPLQDSFVFDWHVATAESLEHLFIEKGADTPSSVGTHQVRIPADYRWAGTSSPYGRSGKDAPREIIPWFLVQRTGKAQGGWYAGIEFSGRTHLTLQRDRESMRGEVGLNPHPGSFRTRLKPGESFDSPQIFLGAFASDSEGAGNVMRRWVRQVLTNPRAWRNPNYPLLVNNSWGSGMAVDEPLAQRMIRDSAELQLDLFHLDAGWFRAVGDWHPDPTKFPHGLAAVADKAHENGLKFGLWVDWTQAGLSAEPGALNARDAKIGDWLVAGPAPDWKPEPFKGETIDLGAPAAHDWAEREVQRIVADYHLDMLEHDGYLIAKNCNRADHPHAALSAKEKSQCGLADSELADCANSTDVSYYAVRAYYDIQSSLRQQHPELLLEICNDGGRLVDFGSAAHGDYFSITDTYDPLSNRRAFYDTSHVLPAAMLETYVERWPTPRIENFRYMLRSGMMGWLSIMQDTTAWSPEQHAAAKEEFRRYKEKLRPLIRDANLFHISPRPDGIHWDAIEYFNPSTREGVIYVFRGSSTSEPTHTLVLQGLDPNAQYLLRFADGSNPQYSVPGDFFRGRDLQSTGLSVTLPYPNSSELIFIDRKPISNAFTQ
jgi:hypothetical protein